MKLSVCFVRSGVFERCHVDNRVGEFVMNVFIKRSLASSTCQSPVKSEWYWEIIASRVFENWAVFGLKA